MPSEAKTTKPKKTRTLRKDRRGVSPIAVAVVTILVVGVAVYLAFTKAIPFQHGFRVNAVFQSAVSIRKNSPVRIAGVNVGTVKAVKRAPGTDASIVTLDLKKTALPLHKDTTMKIRPRIFLEGNFFVDVSPGTPSAPTISDQDTIPITQTSTPVQLDQVLTSLQSDQRDDLKKTLNGIGTALTYTPSASEDSSADPSSRGQSAAQSLNDAAEDSGPALKGTAIVADALLGEGPNDLSKLVAGLGRVTSQLDGREAQLQGLISGLNTTTMALADERLPLQRSIRLLGPTLDTTDRALTAVNASLPNVRGLSRDLIPAVQALPGTIKAGFPWVRQTNALLGQDELRGLVQELRPTTRDLSGLVDKSLQLLPQLSLVAQCTSQVLLPAGNVKIDDGALSSGEENYKELYSSLVGLAGESQNFDGNGQYLRLQPGGGGTLVKTGGAGTASGQTLYSNVSAAPQGTKPAYPRSLPPHVSTVACKDQSVPNYNAARVGPADGSAAAQAVAATPAPGATAANADVARAAVGSATAEKASTGAKDSLASEIAKSLSPWKASK